jgi:hypothetical protein
VRARCDPLTSGLLGAQGLTLAPLTIYIEYFSDPQAALTSFSSSLSFIAFHHELNTSQLIWVSFCKHRRCERHLAKLNFRNVTAALADRTREERRLMAASLRTTLSHLEIDNPGDEVVSDFIIAVDSAWNDYDNNTDESKTYEQRSQGLLSKIDELARTKLPQVHFPIISKPCQDYLRARLNERDASMKETEYQDTLKAMLGDLDESTHSQSVQSSKASKACQLLGCCPLADSVRAERPKKS